MRRVPHTKQYQAERFKSTAKGNKKHKRQTWMAVLTAAVVVALAVLDLPLNAEKVKETQ